MKIAFSLDTVNTRYQEPNRNRVESKYYWEELFSMVPAGGFDALDMLFDAGMMGARCAFPFSEVVIDIKFGGVEAFKAMLKEKGINKIAGLQVTPRAAGSVEQYIAGFEGLAKKMLEYAKKIGSDYIVVSASPEIAYMGALLEKKDEVLAKTAELLNALAAEAGDIKVCVRNDYWGILRGKEIHEFMKGVDAKVGYCVDLANIKIAGEDPVEFIKACGERIGCVYLTDTSFVDEDECYKQSNPQFPSGKATQVFKDLGQGDIDLAAVMAALKEVGYEGWATVSNRQTREVCRGILRARYALNAVM